MARTTIGRTVLAVGGAVAPVAAAIDATNGMTIPQAVPERTILLVTNTDSAAHTVTVEAGDPTMGLGSARAVAVAISAGGSAYVGPFDSAVVQQRDGSLSLDFQAGHVGTVTALLAPRGI